MELERQLLYLTVVRALVKHLDFGGCIIFHIGQYFQFEDATPPTSPELHIHNCMIISFLDPHCTFCFSVFEAMLSHTYCTVGPVHRHP